VHPNPKWLKLSHEAFEISANSLRGRLDRTWGCLTHHTVKLYSLKQRNYAESSPYSYLEK